MANLQVVVHPLVLLNVVDHYKRSASGNKRVVGTLLGEVEGNEIHVTNSFAVPFDEDVKDPTVSFIDHNYLEHMLRMFKKVSPKERVVGWYSTGPKIRPADLDIHELYRRYCPQPAYVIIDVEPQENQLPTEAYLSVEQPASHRLFAKTFIHVPSSVGAYEAEEVGVEHLLRDIRNSQTTTLTSSVSEKLIALQTLAKRLREIVSYLDDVLLDKLSVHHPILFNLQELFNKLPDLNDNEMVKAFTVETNDTMLSVYLGCVLRALLAIHNLVDNNLAYKQRVEDAAKAAAAKKTQQLETNTKPHDPSEVTDKAAA
eukprot:GDKJ01010144.1.p7 GENE.GDKJ01010144.1~~GDKJ01010144.1.p7  ORF type:complete len:324 (+),score=77.80 GDKJ01010144.1:33-974(+)